MDQIYILYTILVLVLVLISAFFSLSETALTTSSDAKIHFLVKKYNNKRAINAARLLRNKESVIGAILLMNNVVNILASAIATSVLIKVFGETGVIYATVIMTMLILIFGEIAPKTYALKNAEKITLFSSSFLLFLVKILYPITKTIQDIINKIFQICGMIKKDNKGQESTSGLEEIRGAIDLKHKSGAIFQYDKDMLDGILSLRETEIDNIMVHRKDIASIDIDQDIEKILKQAFAINHGRIPLWKNDPDNIIAILHVRKLITAFQRKLDINKLNLEDFTTKPWFIPSGNTVRSQLIAFRNRKEKFSIVIDEYGALMGIVTLEDILEEIVGDIDDDERKEKLNKLIKFSDGSYQIRGDTPIRDINRKLNWDLQEDDNEASTLGGLIMAKIERIPEEKEEFSFDGFNFKITKIIHNRIVFLKVKKT